MTFSAGARLGPYEILAPLGAGGMGEVYRARDTRLGREVAIKVLPAELRADRERLSRFEKEARSASALNHPSIVTIHDIGESDGVSYIAMELVSGQTLRELLVEGALPTKRTLHIAAQVTDGLARAHEAGIVHRDLKPENVMVTRDGFAKILDFGLAKLTETEKGGATHAPTQTSGATGPGVVMGTVGYMSPEQALGRSLDLRSDQFSFGSILYEMATGKRAFARGSAPETLSAIIRDEPEPMGALAPLTPTPLRWIVERCLAKDPADRYASTRDLSRDLSHLRDHLSETGASGVSVVAPRRRRRPAAIVPWILAAAGLGLGGYALISRSRAPRPRVVKSFLPPPPGTTFHVQGANVAGPALSRDGRRVAFGARDSDGATRLWIKDLGSLEAYPVPGADGALFPFWSYDGRSIGFFARGRLKVVEASPSPPPPRDLADIVETRGGAWSEDGTIIYSAQNMSHLWRVPAGGGASQPLTRLADGETSHRWPHFLPGGRRFLYEIRRARSDPNAPTMGSNAVYVGSRDGSEKRLVLSENTAVVYAPPGYLLFRRANKLMVVACDPESLAVRGEPTVLADSLQGFAATGASYFGVSENMLVYMPDVTATQARVVWLDRSGREVGTVVPPGRSIHIGLSPDGRAAVVSQIEEALPPDLWIYDTGVGRGIRLTRDARPQTRPVFSADGTRIIFSAFASGPWDLLEMPTQGAAAEEALLKSPLAKAVNDVSPDGRYLLYREFEPRTRGDLKALPLTGDRTPRTYIATPDDETNGDFSPDSRWVAYASDLSGRMEVYAASFPDPSRKIRVSSEGGSQPRWSRDGKELFYVSAGKLVAVPVQRHGEEVSFGEGRALFPLPLFSMTDAGFDIATRYDVAPDGRFLALLRGEEISSPMVLVQNWQEALKRK